MENVDPNAVAAGWDPADGDPPAEHGEFVDGLASATTIDELNRQIGETGPEVVVSAGGTVAPMKDAGEGQ